jgi:hypothetical protein
MLVVGPGDGMVDMTVLEAVAARCRSSSLLLGTSKKRKTPHIIEEFLISILPGLCNHE